MFTLIPLNEIEAALARHEVRTKFLILSRSNTDNRLSLMQTNKEARSAQQLLAQEVTELVHGSKSPL